MNRQFQFTLTQILNISFLQGNLCVIYITISTIMSVCPSGVYTMFVRHRKFKVVRYVSVMKQITTTTCGLTPGVVSGERGGASFH